jgi:hypothetical protein
MLISIPTGTSTIFGAFQAIQALLLEQGERRPRDINYNGNKSSPAKLLFVNVAVPCCSAAEAHIFVRPAVKPVTDQQVQDHYSPIVTPAPIRG